MTLTYRGFTGTIAQLSERTGVPASMILRRRGLGWDIERIFNEPKENRAASKLSAERYLGSLQLEALPPELGLLIKAGAEKMRKPIKNYGIWLRANHNHEFEKWYAEVFAPNPMEALS